MTMRQVSLFLSVLMLSAAAVAAPVRNVSIANFPFSNRERATVAAAFLNKQEDSNHEIMRIEVRAERARVSDRNKVEVDFLRASGSTEVVILISGLGGGAKGGVTSHLAEQIQASGRNVLALPNPLYWQFALGASRTGYPGYTPDDVEDMLPLVEKSFEQIRAKGINIRTVSVMGFSLGGLHAAHLAPLLESRLNLNVRKVILLNPPHDVDQGVDIIDGLFARGASASAEAKRTVLMHMVDVMMTMSNLPHSLSTQARFERLNSELELRPGHLSWLAGWAFRESLSAVILISQSVQDRGLLTATSSEARLAQSKSFSFRQYLTQIVGPELIVRHHGLTLNQMMVNAGLTSQSARLRTDNRYVLLHASDDFLATPELKSWAESTFGSRAVFFDKGGHLGQVWTPEFHQSLREALN